MPPGAWSYLEIVRGRLRGNLASMGPTTVKAVGASFASLVLLVARPALADASPSPRFVLDYTAAPTCPDRASFVAAIQARTARPQLVTEDGEAIALRVAIDAKHPDSASGRLDLREPDGTEETRSVTSRTCAEVASALALVAAVMLDPDISDSPTEPLAPIVTPGVVTPAPPPLAPAPPPIRTLPPPYRGTRWTTSAGAEVGALGGIGPALAPMVGALLEVERSGAFVSTGRISIEVARTESDLRTGSQTYEWLGGSFRLCPIHFEFAGALRAAPCAGMQIAAHRGTTSDVPRPSSHLGLWLAPTLGAALGVRLSSSVTLELQGAAIAPLRRNRFFLAPDSTIFEVPLVSGTASLATTVTFQ